jgi:peptide/nickel transport system ATP-binding protein
VSSQAPGQQQPAAVGLVSAAAARGGLVLEAADLSKNFHLGRGQVLHAVREVSLNLYRSAVVALVGESGSGKSTVARLLAGQEHPTAGTIRLNGKPVELSGWRAFRQYKSEVQLVFQDPFASLNPAHTVGYHIERPLRLHRGALSQHQVAQEAAGLMDQVRLTPADKYLAKYPHELSGGQRQRVSFARALAVEPSVLLADEPVSMLDVSIRLEMLNLLDDLRQRFELALLYITHDIASARYFADEVMVMYAGQIVERGPAEAVTQYPAHPYTQLLVSSAPDPDNLGAALRNGTKKERPGDSIGPPPVDACQFSTRCPFADDRCRTQAPALLQVSASRAAACWRLDVAAPSVYAGREGGGDLTS